MKAISVQQPWATLLVEGVKTIELRSWTTKHRGSLVICASKAPKNVFWRDPADKVNRLLHAGCLIGIVDLLDCRPMCKADEEASLAEFSEGIYAWVTKPVTFCRPDPLGGRLGLFEVPDENLVRIANDETDWIFNYPCPQGEIKFSDRCPLIELD